MPKFSVVVPHHLSQDEALRRIKQLLHDAKTSNADQIGDVEETWHDHEGDFSLKAMGMTISGRLAVRPHEVEVSGDLPLLAAGFKGQIEERLRERATQLLA